MPGTRCSTRSRDAGVAVLTFNRPERMNAWGGASGVGVLRRHRPRRGGPAVRVIVLTGSGGRSAPAPTWARLSTTSARRLGNRPARPTSAHWSATRHPHFVTELTKPVIAAINGSCAGIGLTQALMCDVRFAAAGAKFTTSFARRGLIAEYGISWILPRLIGWGAALDLLLSGRTFFAEEAAELGLVKEVVARRRADESRPGLRRGHRRATARRASMAVIKRAGLRRRDAGCRRHQRHAPRS